MRNEYPNNGFRSYWRYLNRRATESGKSWFAKFLRGVQISFTLIGQILKDAGIELFFLLIFWLIITKMGQGRDLIVSLFEPDGIYGIWRIFYTVLSIISFSVSMWIIPAFIFQQRDKHNNDRRFYRSIFKEHLFFVHRSLPLIPFWLLAFVLFNGKGVAALFIGISLIQLVVLLIFNEKVKEPLRRMWYAAVLMLLLTCAITYFANIYKETYKDAKIALAIILYLVSFVMYFIYHEVDNRILNENRKSDNASISSFNKYKINSWFYLICLALHAVIVALIFSASFVFKIAPESMMLYIFSLNVFIIDLFVYFINVSIRRKMLAIIGIFLIFLLYYSNPYVNLNVSHFTMDSINEVSILKGRERLTFDERYTDLKERILSYKGNGPYPIVLISGEGGGSRAGMWFSQNLINYDRYTKGRFRDHIFSISTVSGSSVGLSTLFAFWEELTKGDSIDQRWEGLPSKVYANNFVGSSISGLLLTDFWKTLLPWGEMVRDRNSTLQDEEAYYTQKACLEISRGRPLEQNESIPHHQLTLARDFMGFFYDTSGGRLAFRKDRPLVFINTCRSNDGRRGIFSPIKLGNEVFNDAIDIAAYLYEDSVCDNRGQKLYLSIKRNISLGQACNTSELFPLFSAPAYIDSLGSFVDGGYHENSGLKTTLDVYQKLSDTLRKDKDGLKYKIYIIYLKNGSSEKDLYKPLPSNVPLTLPLKALFSQPFEGSASYFEERTKYVNYKDPLVQYIEVKLDHRLIVDSTTNRNENSIIEKQITRDLTGAIDTTKKDIILNFPLARWLSKSVIYRMRRDASQQFKKNDSLAHLLDVINTIPMASLNLFKTSTDDNLKNVATGFTRPKISTFPSLKRGRGRSGKVR